MASDKRENTNQTLESQKSLKIAREAGPDASATKVLREFLRDMSPPIESLSPKKRVSATAQRPRSKVFKNILRNKVSSRASAASRSSSSGLSLPHNCIVVPQIVPGQNQQYYRIVRDSSQLDSLETKSTFIVNYEFTRHDVDKLKSNRNVDKKDRGQKSEPAKDSLAHSASTRIKHCFRAQARSKHVCSSENKDLVEEKTSSKNENSQIMNSGARCTSGVKPSVSSRKTMSNHTNAKNMNPQTQEILHQVPLRDDVPQIGDLAPGKAFPASDLIRSWGRRHSVQSTKSSPSRIQGIYRDRISSPMAIVISARRSATRSPLPLMLSKNPARDLATTNCSTASLHSSTKTMKRLASPVKLSAQKHQHQQILNRPRPRMKELVPMALTSNPSNPSLKLASQDNGINQQHTAAANNSHAVAVALDDKVLRRHRLTQHHPTAQDDIPKSINEWSPTKRPTVVSIDLGLPTTPPPRTPLPAVPGNSHCKILSYQSHASPQKHLGDSQTDSPFCNQESPPKPPPRAAERLNLGGQKAVPQLSPPKLDMNKGLQYCTSYCEEASKVLQDDSHQESSGVSELGWPQPPKTSPTKKEERQSVQPVQAQAMQKESPCLTRELQIDSLKRRHLRNTQEQIRSIKSSRNTSITSNHSLLTVIEQAAQEESRAESSGTTPRSLSNKPYRAQSVVNHPELTPTLNLSFSNVRTYAMIQPRSMYDNKLRYKLNGRIVYRSHSTQMTPRKYSSRSDSGSSVSNEDTLLGHYLHPRLTDDAAIQSDTSHSTTTTVMTTKKEAIPDNPQDNLEDAILSRLEKLMVAMEDRLYRRLSEELTTRHYSRTLK